MTYKLIDYEGFEAYANAAKNKYAEKKDIITDDERRYIKLVNEGYTLMLAGDLEVLFHSLLVLICENPSMTVASLLDFIKQWASESDFDEKKVVNSERYKKYGFVGAWQQEQSKNESLLVRHVDGHVLSVEEISSLRKQEEGIVYIWACKPLIDELESKYITLNMLQLGELKFVKKDGAKSLSTNDYANIDKAKVDAIPENPKYTDTTYDLTPYAKKKDVPTKTSELTNDSNFKTETEIQQLISKSSTLKKEVVTSLPTTGKDDVIYLVKDEKGKGNNNYLEYLWLNGKYELIGSTQVDLSDYAKKIEVNTAIDNKLVDYSDQLVKEYEFSGDYNRALKYDQDLQNAIAKKQFTIVKPDDESRKWTVESYGWKQALFYNGQLLAIEPVISTEQFETSQVESNIITNNASYVLSKHLYEYNRVIQRQFEKMNNKINNKFTEIEEFSQQELEEAFN
ncbi:hypothetical protein HKO22_02805 [Peptoniphilus sp. AGMB00490]|uniref:Uncharacterized protein n=1 Tax=Peptoniphilus faecalis TaxID=2731255 RepID=A0A848RGX8_9FIRM|nr:hypothetical protein [Peptoniphilus faecalis]NMW84673.1 hypothetical protein [Peptoniphilus faecalis]